MFYISISIPVSCLKWSRDFIGSTKEPDAMVELLVHGGWGAVVKMSTGHGGRRGGFNAKRETA